MDELEAMVIGFMMLAAIGGVVRDSSRKAMELAIERAMPDTVYVIATPQVSKDSLEWRCVGEADSLEVTESEERGYDGRNENK